MTLHIFRAALLATPLFGSSALYAQSGSVADRLEKLEQALKAQQQIIDAQQAELKFLRAQVAATEKTPELPATGDAQAKQIAVLEEAANAARLAAQEAPRLTWQAGRPTMTSADGRYSFSPRAMFQADFAHYAQKTAGPLTSDFRRGSVGGGRENAAARDLSDGAYFRRARLGFEGAINRDFGYRLIAEFAGSGTEGPARINDAFITYSGFAPFTLQAGAFAPAANMDDSTGAEDTLFMERASPAEVSRTIAGADGRIGIGVRYAGPRAMAALTFTTRTVNEAEVNDAQAGLVGRAGYLLATNADYAVHVGASGTYLFKPADQGREAAGARYPVRLRDRPELRVDSTRLIDTGSIDADHVFSVGAEFGAQYRNFYLQSEYFRFGLDRRGASSLANPVFNGWYVQGSWIVTGENRRYVVANGAFAAPRPFTPFTAKGGSGAWEIAARYSRTNLNFNQGLAGFAPPPGGSRGGEQSNVTLGLNWYLSSNLRVALNYLAVSINRLNPAGPGNLSVFGAGVETPPIGAQIGQDFDILALRLQYGF